MCSENRFCGLYMASKRKHVDDRTKLTFVSEKLINMQLGAPLWSDVYKWILVFSKQDSITYVYNDGQASSLLTFVELNGSQYKIKNIIINKYLNSSYIESDILIPEIEHWIASQCPAQLFRYCYHRHCY